MAFQSVTQFLVMQLKSRHFGRIAALLVCSLLLSTLACQRPATENTVRYPLQVVTTVGMVADLVRSVGGAHVEVSQLMGSGVDPHLYSPTRDDIQQLMEADAIFYCGLHLEGKMTGKLEQLSASKPCVAVTRVLSPEQLIAENEGQEDPHVWMDVSLWSQCCEAIVAELTELDPAHASDFRANADRLQQELAQLHQYGLDSIGKIPETQKVLITSHDAFGYFGRAYGLEVMGVQGLSTESAAGLQRVNELVDLIVQRQVVAVFVESSVPRKSVEALVEGAKSRGHQVAIGGELYSDAMGESGRYTGTYLGMLDHNITLVATALGAEVDKDGWQGKLNPPE